MDTTSLVLQMLWLNVRAEMQHRVNFISGTIGLAISSILSALVAVVIVDRFGNANGWDAGQIVFLFGLWRVQHGVMIITVSSSIQVDELLRDGRLDRFLARPRGTLVQLVGASQNTVRGMGQVLGGVGLIVFGAFTSPVSWTPWLGLWLAVMMVSGTVIQAAIYMLLGAPPLFRVRIDAAVSQIDRTAWQLALFPLSAYALAAQILLTFVIPWGFACFYPGHLLYDRSSDIVFGSPLVYLAPVVAILVSLIAWLVWRAGLRNYQGAGA